MRATTLLTGVTTNFFATLKAYAPELSYTRADFAAVVAHGRLRGVRVVPEFDLPAHMASWAQGYEELITDCPSVNPYPQWPRYYSPADVTNPTLYAVIDEILTELAPVFPDSWWHVGGDEPHFDCWDANANVSLYKAAHNLTNRQLYAWFEGQYAGLLHKHGKQPIGWQEIQTTPETTPDPASTVVEVWEGNDAVAGVVAKGFRTIVSSNWYLNNGGDWSKHGALVSLAAPPPPPPRATGISTMEVVGVSKDMPSPPQRPIACLLLSNVQQHALPSQTPRSHRCCQTISQHYRYYTDDPLSYLPAHAPPADRALVLGGEACMWNSGFDTSSNMVPTIWPNAAAMAEQLWSAAIQPIDKARTRLAQHRCRMVRRGVAASPIAEDYCGSSLYVRKSRSFYFPGDFPLSPETPGP
jgi:hexosaminidase